MELVTEKADKKFIFRFGVIWIGFFTYLFIASNYLWIFLPFLIFGVPFFIFHLIKMREIYTDGDFIKIRKGDDFLEIPLNKVLNIEKFHFEPGSHRLNFNEKTTFGNYVLFIPRRKSIFKKHEAYASFLHRINT